MTSTRYAAFAKLYIHGESEDDVTFGRGLTSLLHAIIDSGSLNKACKDLGISYSKAWKRLRRVEEQMGVKLMDRDGSRGSTLTAEGLELVELYDELNRRVNEFAVREFEEMKAGSNLFG